MWDQPVLPLAQIRVAFKMRLFLLVLPGPVFSVSKQRRPTAFLRNLLQYRTSPSVIICFPTYNELLSWGHLQPLLIVVLLCQLSPKLLLSLILSRQWLTAVLTHYLFVHNWPQPPDSTILALGRPTWSCLQQYIKKKKKKKAVVGFKGGATLTR